MGVVVERKVRIGAGCSFDLALSLPQMVRDADVNYVVIDYMTEVAVSLMGADRLADPTGGWGRGLAGPELARELPRLLEQKTRIVTNAGGLDPHGCAAAVRALAADLGLEPVVAVVDGDDVLDRVAAGGYDDMFTGEPIPKDLLSANAYLGALPVAEALAAGADIVITGRVVDSALTVGPLLHEYGWSLTDYDLLAAGTLIGHLLECGAQPSGGIYTDWREIDWANTSFPIAECEPDGSAVFSKAEGTGGVISVGSLSEQIVYEIGDPKRYFMPDVVCDLSDVRLDVLGPDRIRVSGARGLPPTHTYKVLGIEQTGWRATTSGVVSGPDAKEKAEKVGEAVLERARRLLRDRGHDEFLDTWSEVIGSEASQGAQAGNFPAREAVYRIGVDHRDREAAELMLTASLAVGPSMAPGAASSLGSSVTPRMRLAPFLIDKTEVTPRVTVDGRVKAIEVPTEGGFEETLGAADEPVRIPTPTTVADTTVPVGALAWTRSGDKADMANVGVVARRPEYLPYLNAALSEEAVGVWYSHVFADPDQARVERHVLPGLNAINLLLHEALDGGAVVSRRFDIMGKGFGQQLLDFPVPVPSSIAATLAED
jgi:hypothetical protein